MLLTYIIQNIKAGFSTQVDIKQGQINGWIDQGNRLIIIIRCINLKSRIFKQQAICFSNYFIIFDNENSGSIQITLPIQHAAQQCQGPTA